jgi:group II intron reverse transcriptase/maturase
MNALVDAWRTMLRRSTPRSRLSSGVDDQRIVDFDHNYSGNCRELARAIRSPDGYRFSALRPHFIPKAGGKTRVICVPTVRDRVVQRAVTDFLSNGDRCGLENSVSFGFIPGRSVEQAVRVACRLRVTHRWAYKTDITSFFDAIERDVLADAVRRHVRDRSLHPLLLAAAECEIEVSNRTQSERLRQAGIRSGRGVRQGMPLSPFFANLVLRRFDRTIERAGVRMVRYADDLICLADSEAECMVVHERVRAALHEERLTVPEPGGGKTQVYSPEQAAEFLGLSLRPESGGYVLEVSAEQTAKIRQRIVDFADIPQLMRAGLNLGGFFRRLDGTLAGYGGAYAFASNAAHLEKVLSTARHDAVERLFEKELGIPLASLTAEKRRFIGVDE